MLSSKLSFILSIKNRACKNDSIEPLPFINEVQSNAKQYSKLIEEYKKNPAKTFNQLIKNGISMVREDGPSLQTKELENRLKERI